jgi:hypothetical protein
MRLHAILCSHTQSPPKHLHSYPTSSHNDNNNKHAYAGTDDCFTNLRVLSIGTPHGIVALLIHPPRNGHTAFWR